MWMIWKESNWRIFENEELPLEQVWKRTLSHIRETILAEVWSQEDWKMTPEEENIMNNLNLEQGMVAPQMRKPPDTGSISPIHFSRPSEGFIKLNFDGASKGNPGPAGLRGIFRDDQGKTRWVYSDHGGIMSNNEAELMAVYQGLRTVIRNGYNNLEVEGDSQLVIDMIRKLTNQKTWDKVAKSWRTASLVQDLETIMKRFEYMIINHVRREGNKAVDFLSNWGSNEQGGKLDSI